MKKYLLMIVLSITSMTSMAATSYFMAPKSTVLLVDTKDIFRKNIDLSYEKPCWAEFVGVIEKIVWHKAEDKKKPTSFDMAVGVLLRGDKSQASSCQGSTKEKQLHSVNVYLMEADFKEFQLIENFDE
jgi:hypothetical protein